MTAATDAAAEAVEEVVATDTGKVLAAVVGIGVACLGVAWLVRRIGEVADDATIPVRQSYWQQYMPDPVPPVAAEDQDDEDHGGDEEYPDAADDGGFVR